LIEDLLTGQMSVVRSVMASTLRDTGSRTTADARRAVETWAAARSSTVEAATQLIDAIEAEGGGWSFAKLTIVNGAMRQLAATAAG
jgi:glutamate dehydrogenase